MWPFTKKIRDDDIMRIRVIVHTKSGRVHKSSWKDVSSTKFRELTDKYSFLGFGLTNVTVDGVVINGSCIESIQIKAKK